jgi:predicted nucleic acid-binding protein
VTVIDASVLVAALVDSGPDGTWAEELLEQDDLCAPELVLVEATQALRRAEQAGRISRDLATVVAAELLETGIELFPFGPLATRVWDLRHAVTAYDACYVALAEQLGVPLATLDARLTRAPGVRCDFAQPS